MQHRADAITLQRCERGGAVVGDPGIEPGVRLREGVTVLFHKIINQMLIGKITLAVDVW